VTLGRRHLTFAALAVAAALLAPAVALSEDPPTISAVDSNGAYGMSHSWSPATVTIAQGGAVTFQYQPGAFPQGTSSHSVVFESSPSIPTCGGVPETTSGQPAPWSGTCTFSTPGTYHFICGVHGSSMSGSVTVTGSSGTTTPPPSGDAAAASDLSVPSSQKGTSVRGSLRIAHDGSRLRAVATVRVKSSVIRVGTATKRGLDAGRYRFRVALDKRGKSLLARNHRLSLRLRLEVTAPDGSTTTLSSKANLKRR
jgi:plastocyanin